MKNKNYYAVQGWMVNELKLSSFEKDIFAIIYGFCQNGFPAQVSFEYLANAAGCSRSTAIRKMNNLVKKGLIIKDKVFSNNQWQNAYKIDERKFDFPPECEKLSLVAKCHQSQNVTGGNLQHYNSLTTYKHTKQGTKTTKPHTVKKDSTLIKHKGPITPSMLGPENIGKRVLFRPETSKITLKSDFLSKTPISVVMNYLEGDKAVFSEFEAFLQSLRDMNLKLTPGYVKRQIDLLNTLRDEDDKLTVLRKTMESGWKSLRFVIEDEFGKNLTVKIKTGGKKTNEKRKTY